VVGQALLADLRMMGGESPLVSKELKLAVDKLLTEAVRQENTLAPAEKKHVRATQLLSNG
jgi:hypothetical protein